MNQFQIQSSLKSANHSMEKELYCQILATNSIIEKIISKVFYEILMKEH